MKRLSNVLGRWRLCEQQSVDLWVPELCCRDGAQSSLKILPVFDGEHCFYMPVQNLPHMFNWVEMLKRR